MNKQETIQSTNLQTVLEQCGCVVTVINDIPHGKQYKTANGVCLNAYNSGKLVVQGSNPEKIEAVKQAFSL